MERKNLKKIAKNFHLVILVVILIAPITLFLQGLSKLIDFLEKEILDKIWYRIGNKINK